jgi:hypothetical protein
MSNTLRRKDGRVSRWPELPYTAEHMRKLYEAGRTTYDLAEMCSTPDRRVAPSTVMRRLHEVQTPMREPGPRR